MRRRETHTAAPEPPYLKALSQDVHTLLVTPHAEQPTDSDFVSVSSRRRKPQSNSGHSPPSQAARNMALQLALVLTGVRRAYLLDQTLQREQVTKLAQLLGAAHVSGKGSVVVLCVRASETKQVFVLNASLVAQSSVEAGHLPPVVLVAKGEKPVVAQAEQREVTDLAQILDHVQRQVSWNASTQSQWLKGKKSAPILSLASSGNGETASSSLALHLPALAGWLLEYDVLYSLASYKSFLPPQPAANNLAPDQLSFHDPSASSSLNSRSQRPVSTSTVLTKNTLADQPLVLLGVSLILPWAGGRQEHMLAFSIPEECLSHMRERREQAGSTQVGIIDQLVVRLQERYASRLSASPAWIGVEIQVTKSMAQMNHVAL